jgi:hypothetical protein
MFMRTIESVTPSAPASGKPSSDTGQAGSVMSSELSDADLYAPFEGTRLEPIRLSPLYRIGLVLVMIMMVLLPLIYISLIALIAYGVWFHATNNTGILSASHGGRSSSKGALFAYLTPIVAGCTGILFMIKPLFAPRAKEGARYSLDRATQPRLFTFVERLCRTVRARCRSASIWMRKSMRPRVSGAGS